MNEQQQNQDDLRKVERAHGGRAPGTFCYGASDHIVPICNSGGQDNVSIKFVPDPKTYVKAVWAKTFDVDDPDPTDATEVCSTTTGWTMLSPDMNGNWYSSTLPIDADLGGWDDDDYSRFKFVVVVGRHTSSYTCQDMDKNFEGFSEPKGARQPSNLYSLSCAYKGPELPAPKAPEDAEAPQDAKATEGA